MTGPIIVLAIQQLYFLVYPEMDFDTKKQVYKVTIKWGKERVYKDTLIIKEPLLVPIKCVEYALEYGYRDFTMKIYDDPRNR